MGIKRILLIIPEMTMGGAQRSLSKLSLEFARNHRVWLVVFNKNEGVAYSYGGELLSLDVVPGGGLFNKFKSFMQRIMRLRRLKRELGIDVSISFLEGADYINILSKSSDRIVLSIRGSKRYDETIHGRFFWLRHKVLIPWLYCKADLLVTVNHGIAYELRTHYGLNMANIVTIGNFYNIEEITRLSEEPKEENLNRLYADQVLITTGRLAPEKGLKKLIYVFHGLKKKFRNIRLVMVGDGPEYQELILIFKQLNLDVQTGPDFDKLPDALLLGNQANVFKFLKGATLYLMNSSSEGFPNGLAEAMICQVPVVSSDCPYGPREILEPEYSFTAPLLKPYMSPNGLLMPIINSDSDIQVWIETLSDILEKKEVSLSLAKKGRERINLFDQELIISQWYKVLEA